MNAREVKYRALFNANRFCRSEKDVPPMSTLLRLLLSPSLAAVITTPQSASPKGGLPPPEQVSRDVIDPASF